MWVMVHVVKHYETQNNSKSSHSHKGMAALAQENLSTVQKQNKMPTAANSMQTPNISSNLPGKQNRNMHLRREVQRAPLHPLPSFLLPESCSWQTIHEVLWPLWTLRDKTIGRCGKLDKAGKRGKGSRMSTQFTTYLLFYRCTTFTATSSFNSRFYKNVSYLNKPEPEPICNSEHLKVQLGLNWFQ